MIKVERKKNGKQFKVTSSKLLKLTDFRPRGVFPGGE